MRRSPGSCSARTTARVPARRGALAAVRESEDVPRASPRAARVSAFARGGDRTPQQRQSLHVDDHSRRRRPPRRRSRRAPTSDDVDGRHVPVLRRRRRRSFECRLDDGRLAAVLEPGRATSAWHVGTHSFCVRAIAPDGTVGPETCRTWIVHVGRTEEPTGALHDLRGAFPALLVPGAAPLPLTVTNPFDFDLRVTALTRHGSRPAARSPAVTAPANLQVTQSNAAGGARLDRRPRASDRSRCRRRERRRRGDDARPGDESGRLQERGLHVLVQRNGDASVSSSRSRRVAIVGGHRALVALCVAGVVGAFWSAGSDPGGNGHASAGSLPTGCDAEPARSSVATPPSAGRSRSSRARRSGNSQAAATRSRATRRAPRRRRSWPAARAPATSRVRPIRSAAPSRRSDRSLALHGHPDALQLDRRRERPERERRSSRPTRPLGRAHERRRHRQRLHQRDERRRASTSTSSFPPRRSRATRSRSSLTDGSTTVDGDRGRNRRRRHAHVHRHRRLEPRRRFDHDLGLGDEQLTATRRASTSIMRTKDTVGPTLLSLSMRDTNTNGKVDRVARHLLRDARRLLGRHRALDARERPLRRHARVGHGLGDHRHADDHRRRRRPRHRRRLLHGRARHATPPGSATPPATTPRFAATAPPTAPSRSSSPARSSMQDINANGKVDRVTATFSRAARRLHRHRALDAHQRAQRAARSPRSPPRARPPPSTSRGRGRRQHRRRLLQGHARRQRDRHPRRRRQPVLVRRRPPPPTRPRPSSSAWSMQDTNANGKVDRVVATFSETLAAYTRRHRALDARERPLAAARSPRRGLRHHRHAHHHRRRRRPRHRRRLLHGRARHQRHRHPRRRRQPSLVRRDRPADGAKPVLVAGTLVDARHQRQRQGRPVTATFSRDRSPPPPTPRPGRSPTCPARGTLAVGLHLGHDRDPRRSDEGAGAANTAVGTFKVTLAASATGIRDAAGNQSSSPPTAPTDQATPVLVTLSMQDTNANGKVDRVLAVFSETLAAYTRRHRPLDARERPLAAAPSPPSPSRPPPPRSRSPKAPAPPTPPSAPSRSRSPRNATGIRDAAGNQASLRRHRPADGAKPVLVAGTLVDERHQRQRQGRPVTATFSRAARRLHRHHPVDAHQRAQRAARWPRSPPRAATATLASAEGAGAANTAVGTFTVALAASATGIRDAAGNQSSLRRDRPHRPGHPVLVSLRHAGHQRQRQGRPRPRRLLRDARRLHRRHHPLDTRQRPLRRHLASVTVSAATATLTITEGAGAPDTAVGSFTVALATNATGIRDAAGNHSSLRRHQPHRRRQTRPGQRHVGEQRSHGGSDGGRRHVHRSRSARPSRPRSARARRSPRRIRAEPATTG